MVMARAVAELAVLAIISLLAPGLFIVGQFFAMPVILRVSLCILSPLALFLLFLMLRIPYKVSLSPQGLELRSVLERKNLLWAEIESLKLLSRAGYQEYVLKSKGGITSFPCLLKNVQDLVRSIRQQIPGGGRSQTGLEQVYKMPRPAFLAQIAKLVLQAAFLVLFLYFFICLSINPASSREDLALILFALLAFFLLLAWKLVQTFKQAMEVFLSVTGVEVKTLSGRQSYDWASLEGISKAGVFYPDGLLLKAGKNRILLSAGIDAYDELADELQSRMLRQPKDG